MHGQHVTAVIEKQLNEGAVGVAVVALAYQSIPQHNIHLAENRGQQVIHEAHGLTVSEVGPVSFYNLAEYCSYLCNLHRSR